MLEKADHQHARIPEKSILGAIAMMDVEIDDGHTLQTMHMHRMLGGDGHVIEQAKTHRPVGRCMMTRRPHRAKCVVGFAGHHRIDRGNCSAGCTQRRLPAECIQQRVAVQRLILPRQRQLIPHHRDRRLCMNPRQRIDRRQRRIALLKQIRQTAGD